MNCILCHYAEIGIKGKNRRFFEERLVLSIKRNVPCARVIRLSGRIIIYSDSEDLKKELVKVPGIANFSFAYEVSSSMEEIEKEVVRLMSNCSFNTFRITVSRSDKSFPLSSQKVSAQLGSAVLEKIEAKVDLFSPDVNCFVEISSKKSYIYTEKIKGEGGLPVGTGGRGAVLLSGGIDSPVAAHRMIRRGMRLCFIHFHAYPITSAASMEKVRRIVKILSHIQGSSTIYFVPFADIQKKILLNIKESLRVIIYRRVMMRIAEDIAYKEKARVLITGESLGQVASQTVENIVVTDASVNLPVFRPLIGEDKQGIIKMAESIGTYEISILPEEDCCARFLPRHPETRASIKEVEEEEKKIDMNKILEMVIDEYSKERILT